VPAITGEGHGGSSPNRVTGEAAPIGLEIPHGQTAISDSSFGFKPRRGQARSEM